MFKNIVIGVKEGLEHASLMELAKTAADRGAKLHLVTLVRIGTNEDEMDRLSSAEQVLTNQVATLRAEGYEATHHVQVMVAAAAADLLRIARDAEADLIVIGLAKRTRVGKALMGSDAQRVLLGAECPVLVSRILV